MNKQLISLSSLAMDLKRVSLGIQRGSTSMAQKFAQEAIHRKNEINSDEVESYIAKLLSKLDGIRNFTDTRTAEDALMYSTLFQNYVQNKIQKNT